MRYLSLLIICIAISIFLWKNFDINTYRSHHSTSLSSSNTADEKLTFLEGVKIIESPQKEDWLIDYISWAQKELKIAVYMFTLPSLMEAVLDAKNRWVDVKIILEKNPYNATIINQKAVQFFRNNNIVFHETDSQEYSFMHAKYMLIDDIWIIATANWTRSSFSTNREFFVVGTDPIIRDNLRDVFESDFWNIRRKQYDNRMVIWPTDARKKLIKFIESSEKGIDLYMPSLTDEKMILALQEVCLKEKKVRIILNENTENMQKNIILTQNRCPEVRLMKKPSLHAKVLIIDDQSVFIWSFNFTRNSLENNREIGIFLNGKSIYSIVNIFHRDWLKSIAL